MNPTTSRKLFHWRKQLTISFIVTGCLNTNIRHFVNRHSDFTNSCAHAGAHYLVIIFNFLHILLIEMKLPLLCLGCGHFLNTLNSQLPQIDSLSFWLSLELHSVGVLFLTIAGCHQSSLGWQSTD